MFDIFLRVTHIVRSILSWPFRMLLLSLGVANFKIVYKSGNVEYIFLNNFKGEREGSDLIKASWESMGHKSIVHIGLANIEAIYRLY